MRSPGTSGTCTGAFAGVAPMPMVARMISVERETMAMLKAHPLVLAERELAVRGLVNARHTAKRIVTPDPATHSIKKVLTVLKAAETVYQTVELHKTF